MCLPIEVRRVGLPALEAMACGTPPILEEVSALPEVSGNAARYFATGDVWILEQVICTVLSDKATRVDISVQGLLRAATFPWERTARATAAGYHIVLAAS